MQESELELAVRSQINTILEDTDFPRENAKNTSEREARYEPCARLIKDGVSALKKIVSFKTGVFSRYFSDKPGDPISIAIGLDKFDIQYKKNVNPNSSEEELVLTRNGDEHLLIHTYVSAMGSRSGDILYSEEPPNFSVKKYQKEDADEQTFTEARRLIRELQMDSL